MAAEYTTIIPQEVDPNQPIVFTDTPCPCNQGLIYKKSGGVFLLANNAPGGGCSCGCGCRRIWMTDYTVSVHGSVQIPEGETVGEITLAIVVDGVIDPASVMRITPAAVETAVPFGTEIIVSVPSLCGCENVAVENIGAETVEVLNAVITFGGGDTRRVW